MIIAEKEAVQELKLHPLVRLIGWKVVGCDPTIMGIGPVNAIRGLLHQHKLTLDDIDLIEVSFQLYPHHFDKRLGQRSLRCSSPCREEGTQT